LGDIKELEDESNNGKPSITKEGILPNNKNSCCGY